MNSYRKLANLCDDLAGFFIGNEPASYIGKEATLKPTITISDDGRDVLVVWGAWGNIDGDTRYEMVVEAYYQAFGDEKGSLLHTARGHTPKEEAFLRRDNYDDLLR